MRFLPVAILLLAACESTETSVPRTYFSTDVFEDVPAPRGATYRHADNESFSYRSRTFRTGKFVFDYQGSVADVARFYKETMTAPPYSWTLTKEDRTAEGSTALHFVKNEDRCRVDMDLIPTSAVEKHIRLVVRVNHRR